MGIENILEDIRRACRTDIDRLNERIHTCLTSSSELMSRVVEDNLRTPGKQIRPLMLILCARLVGGPQLPDAAIDAAAAVELLHNASLIHDDIVDESKIRRGRATVNALWDNHVAVLVGDFYTTAAMQRAIATGSVAIIDALCGLGRKLSLGEIEQLFYAREHTLSVENYFKVVDYKTSSLFVASAGMGCLAMGVDDGRKDDMVEFALLFGRCFQLRDDIFDYFDSATVGKPTGNDLREGKVSLPLIHVLLDPAPAEPENCHRALELLRRGELDDSEISMLQQLACRCGGVDYAISTMKELRDRAAAILEKFPDCPERRMLLDLFDFVIARNY